MTDKPVRVRFAPSPTGSLHIGGVRTALFNWLLARRHHGAFILRIENTDQKRTVEGSLDGIKEGLRWLGLDWDEGPDVDGDFGPYIQSERLAMYKKWADWLVENGKAYRDYSTPEELEVARADAQANIKERGGKLAGYERLHRFISDEERAALAAERDSYVIRFAMPLEGETVVNDAIKGQRAFPNADLSDIILLKADGFPTYHLAMAVDDHFMEISHVIRGDEWFASAPMHVQLYDAFGWDAPVFAHVPLITYNGKKLSKRQQLTDDKGEPVPVSLADFQAKGYQREAMLNWLCNLGWTYGDDIEIYSIADAISRFSLDGISAAPADMPLSKLDHLNGHYVREMDAEAFAAAIRPLLEAEYGEIVPEKLAIIAPHVQERANPLAAVVPLLNFLFADDIDTPAPEQMVHKKSDAAETKHILETAHALLGGMKAFDEATLEEALRGMVAELGVNAGAAFNPIRWATANQQVSPPLFPALAALGQDTALTRIERAIARF